MSVAILRHGDYLIASIRADLSDGQLLALREDLSERVGDERIRGIVIDITGAAAIDLGVANHLVQTVEASRLMGAGAIITGLSSKIAQTLVDLGVDLGMLCTVGGLQGGLEEAERLLGHRAPPMNRPAPTQ